MTGAVVADKTPAVPTVVVTGAGIEVATAVVIADAVDVGAAAVVAVVAVVEAARTTVRATLLRNRTLDRDATFPRPNTLHPPANHVAMTAETIADSSPAILNRAAATIAATRIVLIVAEIAAASAEAPHAVLNRAVVSHGVKALGKVRLPLRTIQPKNQFCCPVNLSQNIAASPRPLQLLYNTSSRKFTTNRSQTSKIFCPTAP